MLINNLQEYKQKYSNQRIPIIESVRSQSYLKSRVKNSKTQIPHTLRQKNQSQKILYGNKSKIPKYDINHQSLSNKNSLVSFKEAARMGINYDNSKSSTKTLYDKCQQFTQKNQYYRNSSHQKTSNLPKNKIYTVIEQYLEEKEKINKTETSIGYHRFKSQQIFRLSQANIPHKSSTANKLLIGSNNYTQSGKKYIEDLTTHKNSRYQEENSQRKGLVKNQSIKDQRIADTKLSPRLYQTATTLSQNKNFLKKTEQKKQKNIYQGQKNGSNYKLITLEGEKTYEQKREEERILRDLKFNEVFFCAYCYRYIFAIQKNYHYPKCQNILSMEKMSDKQKYQIGEEKLQILVELAEYTKYKSAQMRQLYIQIIENHSISKREQKISGRSYYTLLQIQTAADIILINLLAPYLENRNNKYLCDNIKLSANSSIVQMGEDFDQGSNQLEKDNVTGGIINNYY